MLGRRFDDGVDLSGGEWQKVALARAYMRDAQLLILDEPTAALDARAEYDVFVRFNELMAGRMAIVISHRFSTVRMADRIIVLQGRRDRGAGHARRSRESGRPLRRAVQHAGGRVSLDGRLLGRRSVCPAGHRGSTTAAAGPHLLANVLLAFLALLREHLVRLGLLLGVERRDGLLGRGVVVGVDVADDAHQTVLRAPHPRTDRRPTCRRPRPHLAEERVDGLEQRRVLVLELALGVLERRELRRP